MFLRQALPQFSQRAFLETVWAKAEDREATQIADMATDDIAGKQQRPL